MMMSRGVAACAVALLLAAPAGATQCQDYCVAYEVPKVCGQVLAEDGAALAAVPVALHEARKRPEGDYRTCGVALGRRLQAGETDDAASFDFSRAKPGLYWLLVTHEGVEEALHVSVRKDTGRKGCGQFVTGLQGRCTLTTRENVSEE